MKVNHLVFGLCSRATWRLLFACLGGLACASLARAQENQVRIDINGLTDQIPITVEKTPDGGYVNKATWLGEGKQDFVTVVRLKAIDAWQETEFTFVPQKSGKIWIQLAGSPSTGQPEWSEFAQVQLSGADWKNPDFTDLTPAGVPEGWLISNSKKPGLIEDPKNTNPAYVAKVISEPGASPATWVQVWHNSRLVQPVMVKAGVPLTLHFCYRLKP